MCVLLSHYCICILCNEIDKLLTMFIMKQLIYVLSLVIIIPYIFLFISVTFSFQKQVKKKRWIFKNKIFSKSLCIKFFYDRSSMKE